jgi:hypothetical protein
VLRFAGLFIACALGWGADDPWQKVKDLKTGSDIRIFRIGSAKPIEAKSGVVTDDKVVVALKKEDVAVNKSEIDHIDYRPPRTRVKTESAQTTTDGNGTNNSWSSGMSWSRDGWQTVYQRKSGAK